MYLSLSLLFLLFLLQLFVKPPQTTTLPSCPSFLWDGDISRIRVGKTNFSTLTTGQHNTPSQQHLMTPPHNYARQAAPGRIFQRRKPWCARVPDSLGMAQSAARAQPHEVSQGRASSPTWPLEAPSVPPPLASFITGAPTLGFQSKPQNPMSSVVFFPPSHR